MRLHAVQTDPVWQDREANLATIATALSDLAPSAGDFVVLPEMCATAWTTEPSVHLDGHATVARLGALAERHGIWLQAGVGLPVEDGRIANAAVVLAPDGALRATYRKNFLFPVERHAFAAGDGIVLVDTGWAVVCPLVCYDLRFPELWRLAALAGAELFAISSAWPSPRIAHWRTLLAARAIENQAWVVASNRCGRDPKLEYGGRSAILDERGGHRAEAGADAAACTLSTGFERASLDAWRADFAALRDLRPSLLGTTRVDRV